MFALARRPANATPTLCHPGICGLGRLRVWGLRVLRRGLLLQGGAAKAGKNSMTALTPKTLSFRTLHPNLRNSLQNAPSLIQAAKIPQAGSYSPVIVSCNLPETPYNQVERLPSYIRGHPTTTKRQNLRKPVSFPPMPRILRARTMRDVGKEFNKAQGPMVGVMPLGPMNPEKICKPPANTTVNYKAGLQNSSKS